MSRSRNEVLQELLEGNALYTHGGFSKHAQCSYDVLASLVSRDRYITELVIPERRVKLYLLFYSRDTGEISGCLRETKMAIEKLRLDFPGAKAYVMTCHRTTENGQRKYLFQIVSNVVFPSPEELKRYVDREYTGFEFLNRRVYGRFCYLTCINQSTIRVGELDRAPLTPSRDLGDNIVDPRQTFVTLTEGEPEGDFVYPEGGAFKKRDPDVHPDVQVLQEKFTDLHI